MRLEKSKSKWVKDLPSILWEDDTIRKIPTGEMPFFMIYGTKSVIQVKIRMSSFRTLNFNKENNKSELRLNLDLLDEKRERAEVRQAAYKH